MDNDIFKLLAAVFASLAFIVWGINELNDVSCHAITSGMKVTTEYGFWSGCRVSTSDGRMVPLEVYREFKQQN